jgi:hypothetical protein
MKKNLFSVFVVALMLSSSAVLAQVEAPRLGIGMQASFPTFGISAKYDFTETHSAQAVVGVIGPFSNYFGRYSYHFPEKKSQWNMNYRPYLYGQAGIYSYDFGFEIDGKSKENIFGWGLGAGIETSVASWNENLRFSMEVGYGKVDFEYYNFRAIMFGTGIHYYFNL